MSEARRQIVQELVEVLRELSPRWKAGAVADLGPELRLAADLGMSSLHFVRMVAALQQRRGGAPLPFEQLFVDEKGGLRSDVSVEEVADFIVWHQAGNGMTAHGG